jgi:hypothetical protein
MSFHGCESVALVVKDRTFLISKQFLANRSPVFNAMFENGMIESVTKRVIISDFSEKTVETAVNALLRLSMIEFVGKIRSFDLIKDLLIFADKYEIKRLRDACDIRLVKHINTHNIFEVLIFADIYSAEKTKKNVSISLLKMILMMSYTQNFTVNYFVK